MYLIQHFISLKSQVENMNMIQVRELIPNNEVIGKVECAQSVKLWETTETFHLYENTNMNWADNVTERTSKHIPIHLQWNTVNPTSQGTGQKMSDHPCCRINRGKIHYGDTYLIYRHFVRYGFCIHYFFFCFVSRI